MRGDCFIRFDQVVGEAADPEMSGAIDVSGWNWGVSTQDSRDAKEGSARANNLAWGAVGSAQVRSFEFTHYLDRASAALLKRCVSHQVIKNATMTLRRAGGGGPQTYLVMTFSKVRIVSVLIDYVEDEAKQVIPRERVVFAFETVSFDYTMQSKTGANETGKHSFTWNMGATA